MPDEKLNAKSFLLRWKAVVPWRVENYMRKVSCRNGWQWCHGGWETICEKFPVVMEGSGAMPDGKLYAKGFLS